MLTAAAQILSLAPLPALLFAAANDVAVRRVPDWASALIMACGLAARLAAGDLLPSLGLALLVFALLFACWRCCWLGGGDVKLLTACAVLVPAHAVPGLVLAIALAGGLLSSAYLIGRHGRPMTRRRPVPASAAGQPKPTRAAMPARSLAWAARVARVEGWRIRRRASLPYACAIAAGCVFTLIAG